MTEDFIPMADRTSLNKRGITLPVNVVIIVILALMALVLVASFISGGSRSVTGKISGFGKKTVGDVDVSDVIDKPSVIGGALADEGRGGVAGVEVVDETRPKFLGSEREMIFKDEPLEVGWLFSDAMDFRIDPGEQAVPVGKPRALYVWDEESKILENENDEIGSLIEFCQGHNINMLYYSATKEQLRDQNMVGQFNSLIHVVHRNNMQIHALMGDPRWTTQHEDALEHVTAVVQYNIPYSNKFDGIHLDVEPHLCGQRIEGGSEVYECGSPRKDWESAGGDSRPLDPGSNNEYLAKQYLSLLTKVNAAVGNLEFGVSIPFWYDNDGFDVEHGGQAKKFSSHVQDITDYVTIMAYTIYPDWIDGWVAEEVVYASGRAKQVVVALETKDLGKGSAKSFYWRAGELEDMITHVNNGFPGRNSFRGVAIHYYRSYETILSGDESYLTCGTKDPVQGDCKNVLDGVLCTVNLPTADEELYVCKASRKKGTEETDYHYPKKTIRIVQPKQRENMQISTDIHFYKPGENEIICVKRFYPSERCEGYSYEDFGSIRQCRQGGCPDPDCDCRYKGNILLIKPSELLYGVEHPGVMLYYETRVPAYLKMRCKPDLTQAEWFTVGGCMKRQGEASCKAAISIINQQTEQHFSNNLGGVKYYDNLVLNHECEIVTMEEQEPLAPQTPITYSRNQYQDSLAISVLPTATAQQMAFTEGNKQIIEASDNSIELRFSLPGIPVNQRYARILCREDAVYPLCAAGNALCQGEDYVKDFGEYCQSSRCAQSATAAIFDSGQRYECIIENDHGDLRRVSRDTLKIERE